MVLATCFMFGCAGGRAAAVSKRAPLVEDAATEVAVETGARDTPDDAVQEFQTCSSEAWLATSHACRRRRVAASAVNVLDVAVGDDRAFLRAATVVTPINTSTASVGTAFAIPSDVERFEVLDGLLVLATERTIGLRSADGTIKEAWRGGKNDRIALLRSGRSRFAWVVRTTKAAKATSYIWSKRQADAPQQVPGSYSAHATAVVADDDSLVVWDAGTVYDEHGKAMVLPGSPKADVTAFGCAADWCALADHPCSATTGAPCPADGRVYQFGKNSDTVTLLQSGLRPLWLHTQSSPALLVVQDNGTLWSSSNSSSSVRRQIASDVRLAAARSHRLLYVDWTDAVWLVDLPQ